jgi:flagellar biosynthesis GTPase FlhF
MATISSRNAAQTSSPEHKLPESLTSFVGRTRELKGIGESLKSSRVVTLAGPGGVGRTRLRLELGPAPNGSPG